jgi:hypothetical protein
MSTGCFNDCYEKGKVLPHFLHFTPCFIAVGLFIVPRKPYSHLSTSELIFSLCFTNQSTVQSSIRRPYGLTLHFAGERALAVHPPEMGRQALFGEPLLCPLVQVLALLARQLPRLVKRQVVLEGGL